LRPPVSQAARPAEFAAFRGEPPQMRSGAVGKSGYLRLGFELRGGRTILADLDARTPFSRSAHCIATTSSRTWRGCS
jgi:urease accessory protein